MSMHTSGQFRGLRDATPAAEMRGAVDFTQADSFNLYEKGHSILKVLSVPNFMTAWASRQEIAGYENATQDERNQQEQRRKLCNNFYKILEQEFKGLDGLDDMSADSMNITDGFSTLNVLGKVNYATNQEITMKYTEKGGSTISRYAETYLRGIRDPRTGVKHYNGCLTTKPLGNVNSNGKIITTNKLYEQAFSVSKCEISSQITHRGLINPSFENEVFTFLYMVLDNTWTQLERAYLLCNAQINKIPLGQLSNIEKGNIELAEIDLSFNCFVVSNANVNAAAAKYLPKILNESEDGTYKGYNLISNEFNYSAQKKLTKAATGTAGDGTIKKVNNPTTSLSK